MADILQEIASSLHDGNDKEAAALVQQALDKGMPSHESLQSSLIAGMDDLGKDSKANELFCQRYSSPGLCTQAWTSCAHCWPRVTPPAWVSMSLAQERATCTTSART